MKFQDCYYVNDNVVRHEDLNYWRKDQENDFKKPGTFEFEMRISEHCRYRWYEISKIYTGVHGGLCDPSFWEVGVNEDVLKMKV